MSQNVQLEAKKRDGIGSKAVTILRAEGNVPAVMQERNKESVHLTVDGREMLKVYRAVGTSQTLTLTIGTTKKLALIKELQLVPLRSEVQHVVFQALKQDELVDAVVPIRIVGEIPAENNRLALLHTLETVEVRALPKDLPEALEVSGDKLVEVDDRLTIADIKLPSGVELVELLATADDEEKHEEFLAQPIVLVKEPTSVESDEGTELAEGETEAGAVESEKGGDSDQGGVTESDNPGGKKAKENHGE